MPVRLTTVAGAGRERGYDRWAAIGGAQAVLAADKRVPGLVAALEATFDAVAPDWWALGRRLGGAASAGLAHAPACVANASDMGLMLAWTHLVDAWAAAAETTLVLCDDPWLFRHLRRRPGVGAARAPLLWPRRMALAARGFVARVKATLAVVSAALVLKPRHHPPIGASWLLVYGHPVSGDDRDAYFGDLMVRFPDLRRALHVDCRPADARRLASDGRTVSLHAWGSPLYPLALPFARWRPDAESRRGPDGWLVRRAADREGGTGQAAMIRWQQHCQERWLAAARPRAVAWPWENQAWERAFVAAARRHQCLTLGYQHSVIGRQMLNYSPASIPDGADGLPDKILCSGPATRDQLAAWGVPADRLAVGGALRFAAVPAVRFDPAAPVFMALPFDSTVAAEMVAAARRASSAAGRRFLVKDHPMTPYSFANGEAVRRTDWPLGEQETVSAVVYAATTVGLEALLLGLPTFRFRPAGRIAIDILPDGVDVPVTTADTLDRDLAAATPPAALPRERVFAAVDAAAWTPLTSKGETEHES